MKLYTNATGGNCRRVAIYLKEKGLSLETQNMDVSSGELKAPEFLAKNPAGLVPLLELDDGATLPESSAIMEYLEELHPTPTMLGITPFARARTRALERIAGEMSVVVIAAVQHTHPYFAQRIQQNPAVGEALQKMVDQQLAVLEAHLGDADYLGGATPTIADCTLFPTFQTCRERMQLPFAEGYVRLNAWYGRFQARPSAAW